MLVSDIELMKVIKLELAIYVGLQFVEKHHMMMHKKMMMKKDGNVKRMAPKQFRFYPAVQCDVDLHGKCRVHTLSAPL